MNRYEVELDNGAVVVVEAETHAKAGAFATRQTLGALRPVMVKMVKVAKTTKKKTTKKKTTKKKTTKKKEG